MSAVHNCQLRFHYCLPIGVPERNLKYEELEKTVMMLRSMVESKYAIAHIFDGGPYKDLEDTPLSQVQ